MRIHQVAAQAGLAATVVALVSLFHWSGMSFRLGHVLIGIAVMIGVSVRDSRANMKPEAPRF